MYMARSAIRSTWMPWLLNMLADLLRSGSSDLSRNDITIRYLLDLIKYRDRWWVVNFAIDFRCHVYLS